MVNLIARDGRDHIEDVLTQIVTEYFRRVFRDVDRTIGGISYSSAREGGSALVLFCENEQCFEVEDGPMCIGQM